MTLARSLFVCATPAQPPRTMLPHENGTRSSTILLAERVWVGGGGVQLVAYRVGVWGGGRLGGGAGWGGVGWWGGRGGGVGGVGGGGGRAGWEGRESPPACVG